MKLKALAALCKREGAFYLYDNVDADGVIHNQWLGAGGAIYPLAGLPRIEKENLIAMFDITEKQREKIHFQHSYLPVHINFEDVDPEETMLDRTYITLGYGGRVIKPLFTRGGLELMDLDYLKPLADVADDLELYERHTKGGTYFAAKMGFMLVGVIMPLNIIEESFVENIERLARKCRAALELKAEQEKKAIIDTEVKENA